MGLLDTSFSIVKDHNNAIELIISPYAKIHQAPPSDMNFRCHVVKKSEHNFCGIGIGLGKKGIDNGLDLSAFKRFALTIKYKASKETSKLKVSFRNYNDHYANTEDSISLKFNSINYNPNRYNAQVVIPFDALQVDKWWVDQYKVGFVHSQVELTNVSFVEVLSEGLNVGEEYQIEIEDFVLYGEYISEATLLKLILLVWLMTVIYFTTLQHTKLKHMSVSDSLTGIYNRRGIRHWTNKRISNYKKQQRYHMFYLDLDDFKKVNDTYGHLVGDQLLIGFCQHIQHHLQSTPSIISTFARLSGDEFLLITQGLNNHAVTDFAETLLSVLDKPILLEHHELYARASLGIAELNTDIKTFENLLARADSAMYYAKKNGKNQYMIFNESLAKDIFFRKQTSEKIKNAIIQDDFYLNFMPIFDAKTLKATRVEVLLRTNATSLKGIGPDIFIPIAEEFNLIKNIDLWVIEATFKQIIKETQFLERDPFIFCINISAVELHNPLFVPQLEDLLSLYQIDPKQIELELTETSLVETDQMSISTLESIHALGIKLALDDFGTGYTAFSQLINYPVDTLKIDKSFIDNLDYTDNTQSTMIKAILAIAQSYQLKTIGEGIEEYEQYQFLVAHGCDFIQGYLFSKPMLWEDLKQSIHDPASLQKRLAMRNRHDSK